MAKADLNLAGVKTIANVEVIDVLEETNPYPSFLGINLKFGNSSFLNLKNKKMTFDSETM